MPSHVPPAGAEQDLARAVEELKRELGEAHRREAATAEVLKVISRSAFDLQRVLDTLVESAAKLCEAEIANIWRPTGATYRLAASYGVTSLTKDWLAYKEYLAGVSYAPGRGSCVGRTLLERRAVQINDIRADPEYDQRGSLAGVRTMLGVPLLRDGTPIGVMILVCATVRPFTAKQIELIETFADQAVIAIENTRLFEAEQARTRELEVRTRELTESLQQQIATANVLKAISRLTFDLQPVLDTLLENATSLCDAESGLIWRFDGEVFRAVAAYGVQKELVDFWAQNPIRPGRGSVTGRAALERRTVHITDALGDSEYQLAESQRIGGYRTLLGVPMLREDVLIGVFGLQRYQVQPFTDKQIDLVTTFADQAVIAIENVRLFEEVQAKTHELSRSVAELQALGEVAQAVSSTLDLKVVLARILEHACAMSDAGSGAIYGFDESSGHFVLQAGHNMIEEHIAGRVRASHTTWGKSDRPVCQAASGDADR